MSCMHVLYIAIFVVNKFLFNIFIILLNILKVVA